MATLTATIRPDKVAEVLAGVEDLLLDHNDDPFLLTGGERAAIVTFEQVATTAIEDGRPLLVGWLMADLLHEQCVLDSADLVGGQWPLSPDAARWVASNPEDCTQHFDGICRCTFDPTDR
jgi:hypothetical protein